MSTPLSLDRTDAAVHSLFQHMVPALDPPEGAVPDAERLAALGEGLLLPHEEAALLAEIAESPAARAELRALYPTRFDRLFGEPAIEVGARVLRFPIRRVGAAAAALAAAAAVALMLTPPGPPSGGGLALAPASAPAVVRGALDPLRAEPGTEFHLMMQLGEPGLLDRLRGAEPWGALVAADDAGAIRLVCTSREATCRSSARTMAWRFSAPVRAGARTFFAFVVSGRVDPGPALDATLEAARAAELRGAAVVEHLEAGAAEHGWQIHAPQPVIVVHP